VDAVYLAVHADTDRSCHSAFRSTKDLFRKVGDGVSSRVHDSLHSGLLLNVMISCALDNALTNMISSVY